ncbi:MAG: hypothetical protein CO189_06310 [candidate division Zixibacteria bacterium CG_4_9_14_3_um_filter_46_8]|nr:MAG: hypothetical protein CO189_06310 [candidate division Zixibacteria bacterium CG_4_9_14_3_um_filter_46_8]
MKQKKKIIDPYEIKKEDAVFIWKSMDFFSQCAKILKAEAENASRSKNINGSIDQDWLFKENMYAGSSFLYYCLYCEALINQVWEDFKIKEAVELPPEILKKIGTLISDARHLPFKDRLYITPYICNRNHDIFPKAYYHKETVHYQRVIELFQVRDSYVHSKSRKEEIKFTTRKNKVHHIDNSQGDKSWPQTRLPRNITVIEARNLQIVEDISNWIFETLNKFLGYRLDEKWKLDSIKLSHGVLTLGSRLPTVLLDKRSPLSK